MGAKVRAFDPVGMEAAKRELPDIVYCDDAYACADGADALVIVTEWALRGQNRTHVRRSRPPQRCQGAKLQPSLSRD
jgi:UDP-glucose 6-dehydrogenase